MWYSTYEKCHIDKYILFIGYNKLVISILDDTNPECSYFFKILAISNDMNLSKYETRHLCFGYTIGFYIMSNINYTS